MVLDGTPKKIIKLSTAVINKIAAGEIIHRPASAVKELIENSLDAEAKKISITVKEGGVKALQVQDTGNGIRKEDLSIVCKRFTTSKLREFEDLRRIRTFGFRGEALASISHVSHLSITTRTRTEQCAYKAFYCDGHLTSPQPGLSVEPVPFIGPYQIFLKVEDLFYNMDTRRKTLKSSNEEYLKIHTVVCNYSINFPQVSFTLKKFGEAAADYRTPADSTSRSNIKAIYGQKVEAELLEIEQLEESLELGIVGLISNANFSLKRGVFVLFINGRLLECPAIRKAIDNVYSAHLPKHAHSFCYLSLTMNPANVDVNVHPTKNEVHFLHANRIIEVVQETTRARLLAESSSRTFYSQVSLFPSLSVALVTFA
ncbi:hypothetical protein Zmor_012246 [Zophobas morio]|uniref:DNA mismatch repair protein S5 domain-containing protein n=1 Tax=Zophobas morio TaxID=2755281 RepID=A0AA38HI27_9CUCU|nr:hypothetical protein Zmor_012246 [Zophobas morio]